MPVPSCNKILQYILISSFILFIAVTPDYAQRNPDSSVAYNHNDSLQIHQLIKSREELERKLEQTQNALLRKQTELATLDEKIKNKELILKEKLRENRPGDSKNGLFNNFSFIFFIIGIICLIYSFFKIKKS
ncbi:hypothetical protein JW964_28195 [candidate division KSB1 bacterium]|nr:hypothetical protein [candidate division KSB1 bacterium]